MASGVETVKKEEILKFYHDYRFYIFPAIVALSSLILIIFVIYPQALKLITNQIIGKEISNKLKFLEVKAQTLESYDPADLNRKVNFALGSYPTDKDFVSAMDVLQNLTSQSGFNVISMSLGLNSSKSTGVQSYNLKLDILGPSTQLSILLSNIESSPRLMRVSSVETAVGKDPQVATISLNIDVLYSSAPKEFGSVDSPLPELSDADEEGIAKIARASSTERTSENLPITTEPLGPLGPRGKSNPFE